MEQWLVFDHYSVYLLIFNTFVSLCFSFENENLVLSLAIHDKILSTDDC